MGKKVFVIDDSFVGREIIKDYLADGGYEVVLAASGKEAVLMLENDEAENYLCILLDIEMPEMNGYDTAKAIRDLGRGYDNITIFAMSANSEKEDVEKAYESGMDDYITKPVNMMNLFDKLHGV